MTKRDDLQALHDAVKAGRIIDQDAPSFGADLELLWNCFPTATPPVSDGARHARWAWGGSLDAAHALHRAVLPGWAWAIECANAAEVWPLGQLATAHRAYSDEGNPARAWLLAILAALIAMEGK